MKVTFSAILATLEKISESDSIDRAVEACGLLVKVKLFQFLLSLLLFEKIFSVTAKLSDVLQAEQLNYAAAAACIRATKATIQDLRSETEWKKIWLEVVSIAGDCSIAVNSMWPRRRQRLPDRFSDTVVTAVTTGSRCDPMVQDEYRTQVYYATLNVVVTEMNQRFSDLNLSLLGAIESLFPTSEKFLDVDTTLPFLQHYNIKMHMKFGWKHHLQIEF